MIDVATLAELCHLRVVAMAAQRFMSSVPSESLERAREAWGHTNVRIALDERKCLAHMLAKLKEIQAGASSG